MFEDDISKLVAQTFDNVGLGSFNNHFNLDLPDEVPGVLYKIQSSGPTFVLRIHPSENLNCDYQKLMDDPLSFHSLKIADDELDDIHHVVWFFECDNIQMAHALKSHLANKRFPLHEENIFNLSDPGDSWWLECRDNQIVVHFKLTYRSSTEHLVKLGPLGSPEDTQRKLLECMDAFCLIFPVEDFSSGYGQFSISTSHATHPFFAQMISLFKDGETNHDFWVHMSQIEYNCHDEELKLKVQKLTYLLMEVSVIRRFWKRTQKLLDNRF